MLLHAPSSQTQKEIESLVRDDTFSKLQGRFYSHFVNQEAERYPASLSLLADQVISDNDAYSAKLMGGLAYRDHHFIERGDLVSYKGDQVAWAWWKKKFVEMKNLRDIHPSYNLGLMHSNMWSPSWFTYQFVHSGALHFIANMAFLLIFAGALEVLFGGFLVLSVYLLSGLFAALVFVLLGEGSAVPLIGASGSVSGIMAFFAVVFWNRMVCFLYFLFIPIRGYAGFVYLPAWVTLLMWSLSDLSGLFSTPKAFGGVAHSAHLGGLLAGLIIGLIFMYVRKLKGQSLDYETCPVPSTNKLTVIS